MAADPAIGRAWPVHCYGMVGAGRDNDVDCGGGTELYVVIGQAPRHLDRNITLLGRVVQGMELLRVMPRGSGAFGFYEHAERACRSSPCGSQRGAENQRAELEILRTDTPTFRPTWRRGATGSRNGSRCRPDAWTSVTFRPGARARGAE